MEYSQFEELESFARFGTRLDEHTRSVIEHGKRIRACLKQKEQAHLSAAEQIVLLLALTNKLLDNIALEKVEMAENELIQKSNDFPKEILKRIYADKPLDDADRSTILEIAKNILKPFQNTPKADQKGK